MPINAQSANPLMRLTALGGRAFGVCYPWHNRASSTHAPTAPLSPGSDGPLPPLAQQESLAREYRRLLSLQSNRRAAICLTELRGVVHSILAGGKHG